MTSKEKAIELYKKFLTYTYVYTGQSDHKENAIKCALIAVDEIIDSLTYLPLDDSLNNKAYWQEVKQHLTHL